MRLTVPTAIVLDESPLSLLTRRVGHPLGDVCRTWFLRLESAGHRFYVPEAGDYELRRELLRAGQTASVTRLDVFNTAEPDRYLPLTTEDWRVAAGLWARVRNAGLTTAPPDALDGDVLIAAQSQRLSLFPGLSQAIVATSNANHLSRLVPAALGDNINL